MRVMLDTHIALWAAEGASQLSARAVQVIADPINTLFVSVAAVWEIAIKHAKGNLRISPRDARSAFRLTGLAELPITGNHAQALSSLPKYVDHADPFDRLMVAQSLHEDMLLLTADPKIWRYHPVLILHA